MIFSAIIKVVWGEWGDIRRYNSKRLELKVYIKFLRNLYQLKPGNKAQVEAYVGKINA